MSFGKIGITIEFVKGTKRYWHFITNNWKPEEIVPESLETLRLEELRNWIRTERIKRSVTIQQVQDKILELDFQSEMKRIQRTLFDNGDLVGIDVL